MNVYMLAPANRQVKPAAPATPLDLAYADACVAFAGRWPCRQFLQEAL